MHKTLYKLVCLVNLQTTPHNHEHLPVDINIKLVLVYYNRVKPNMFRVHVDVTLFGIRDKLDQINGHLIKYL